MTASSFRSNPRLDGEAPGVTGARAEALAARYLAAQGLAIVARNFRTRFGEIDLIARDRGVLVFVEVR
ncbi:MAG TPA: YraN family protein, partial [Casimicrobiaceae bacterium]|nr:YraN family protein [Casimicrobiaceae bacterium]